MQLSLGGHTNGSEFLDLSEDLELCYRLQPSPTRPEKTHEGRYMRAGFLSIELRWEEDQ